MAAIVLICREPRQTAQSNIHCANVVSTVYFGKNELATGHHTVQVTTYIGLVTAHLL